MTQLPQTLRRREAPVRAATGAGATAARAMAAGQAVVGGLVTEAAFPDRSWWPLALVGVALLVLALEHAPVRRAAFLGLAWGLAFFVPHLAWADRSAGTLPWLLLATLQAVLVAAGTAGWSLVARVPGLAGNPGIAATAFALTWVATEQLRASWPFGGFPWGRLAFSQTDGPLLRLAWLGGAPLVSAAVAAGGFALAVGWRAALRRRFARSAVACAVAAGLVAAPLALPIAVGQQAGSLRLGAVQGNVTVPAGGDPARAVLDNHVAETLTLQHAASGKALDLVLWPENATDIDPRADGRATAAVDHAARAVGAPILVGTSRYVDAGRYNELLLWQPGRGPAASYAKQRPVPFGEYIPFRGLARRFSPAVDRARVDMVAGTAPALVRVDVPRLGRPVPVATVICFEVAFDDLVRDAVTRGAEVIVVATNNASFGRTAESTQQLAMSRLRAVEHGRAVIQVSTVGVSAVVAPDGAIGQRTALFTADAMVAEVPLRTTLTPADRLGALPGALAVTGTGALLVAAAAWRLRTRARRPG